VPKPKAALTDTFTVNSALLNGSAVADPTNVVASDFPSSFTVGDSIVIVYSFTSTADTPKAKKHKRKYKKKGSIEPTEATAPTKPIKKLRNPCVPSSLRTAFRTFLTDGHVTNSVIEYLMGHNLTADLTKTYTNKSDDSWRETWKADCEPFLTFKV
jgi:hypothetical protein